MPTKSRLEELLSYNPETGVFTRAVSTNRNNKEGDVAGCLRGDGYVIICVDGERCLAHRLAWLYYFGENPQDQIDHINHDRSDNRIVNLREVTSSGNNKNRSVHSRNKKTPSGIMGVRWEESRRRWESRIKKGGKTLHLGRYRDLFSAICARKSAESRLGFHPNHGIGA